MFQPRRKTRKENPTRGKEKTKKRRRKGVGNRKYQEIKVCLHKTIFCILSLLSNQGGMWNKMCSYYKQTYFMLIRFSPDKCLKLRVRISVRQACTATCLTQLRSRLNSNAGAELNFDSNAVEKREYTHIPYVFLAILRYVGGLDVHLLHLNIYC
jgi:hypothetical protein